MPDIPAQPALTPAQATALLEDDKQQRLARCRVDIQGALDAHRCDLVAVPQLTADGRIGAVVQLVAR